jgi:hypothetical protein
VSQFAFLQREWPAVFDSAGKAEAAVHADPRTACFYAHRTLELADGVVEAAMLYESPFTDLTPRGPEELFSSAQVDELVRVLDTVRSTAIAA